MVKKNPAIWTNSRKLERLEVAMLFLMTSFGDGLECDFDFGEGLCGAFATVHVFVNGEPRHLCRRHAVDVIEW